MDNEKNTYLEIPEMKEIAGKKRIRGIKAKMKEGTPITIKERQIWKQYATKELSK